MYGRFLLLLLLPLRCCCPPLLSSLQAPKHTVSIVLLTLLLLSLLLHFSSHVGMARPDHQGRQPPSTPGDVRPLAVPAPPSAAAAPTSPCLVDSLASKHNVSSLVDTPAPPPPHLPYSNVGMARYPLQLLPVSARGFCGHSPARSVSRGLQSMILDSLLKCLFHPLLLPICRSYRYG